MNCYCYETEEDFILCVENAEVECEEIILHAWFEKTANGYIKTYPMKNGIDKLWYKKTEDKELIKENFARLGPTMFNGAFEWKNVLLTLAERFFESGIEWYIFGSSSETVLGVDIKPNDIDIIVHTKDFYKVKEIFPNNIVEPFVDNKDTWLVRYFGRLCVGGAIVDIVASDKMNMGNHHYDKVLWNGFEVLIEPFQTRYTLETNRNRPHRLKAMEEYMKRTQQGFSAVPWC